MTKDPPITLTGKNGMWIFPAVDADAVNVYADFLQAFTAAGNHEHCHLIVSADTDFTVWLNGVAIGGGQYSDYPDRKTYECFDVGGLLHNGENRLAFTVFYNGRNSSVYRRGAPGLFFALTCGGDTLACSGTETLCRLNPAYHSGPIAVVSGQLAYTFGYDARQTDDFQSLDYKPSSEWRTIRPDEAYLPSGRTTLSPRPVARLIDNGLTTTKLLQAGYFRRDTKHIETLVDQSIEAESLAGLTLQDGTRLSPGWLMQHDQLTPSSISEIVDVSKGVQLDTLGEGLSSKLTSLDDHDGIYLFVDMEREEAGYLEIEIEAPAGTIIDIGYGEHLDDARPRTFVGGRSFAGRLIAGNDRFVFRHEYLRWAGRYLSVHITSAHFKLYRLGLRRRDYPLTDRGTLKTSDPHIEKILQVSRRTLSLCMHEHYEDTPWREQALYANDARTQALCGYYAFGETAFPRSSFNLLGQGLRTDGYLELTAPARPKVTIPSFTLVWILAVRDHYLYSGDSALASAFLPQIQSMLLRFLDRREQGLMTLDRAPDIWHFYDWSGGMSGYSNDELAAGLTVDAPLNCFLMLALEALCEMHDWQGTATPPVFKHAITEIRQAIETRFWDAEEGAFRTTEEESSLTELTQALALLAGVGDASMREKTFARLTSVDSKLAAPGLSQSFYTYSAKMLNKRVVGPAVFSEMEAIWSTMLKAGATTFWETLKGASDFHNAGSLCHGWSAGPLYFYFHDLLGIRPIEPGFRSFTIDPTLGFTTECEGTIPIPGGTIQVSWKDVGGKIDYQVKAPEHCRYLSNVTNINKNGAIQP
jgi:alpha-L-rhamnosidase